ncbi:MAG: DUF1587 domain-containing protein [Pirellulales bacterium]
MPRVAVPDQHRPLLTRHCGSCHGAKNAEANFRIDDLPGEIADLETAARWQKILNALNSGEMPPPDEPQLDKTAKADLLDDLAHTLVAARRKLGDQRGVITMRRLNRREYSNTLRELLGVEINVNELPADTGSGRFDTGGKDLFMSDTQFEQYLTLGREALDEAFEREAAAGFRGTFRVEAEEVTPKVRKHIDHQIDAQQRGRDWTKLVDDAVAKSDNAKIVAEIRAGPLGNHQHIFYRNWRKFPNVPAPETFGFQTVEENADKAVGALNPFHLPYHRYYLEQSAIDAGAYLAIPNEHPAVLDTANVHLLVPFSWPVGDYVVRFRAAATDDAEPDRRFIEFGINPRVRQAMSTHEISGTLREPQIVEFPLTLTRGNRERANRSLFLREKGTHDHFQQTRLKADAGRRANNNIGRKFSLWVDWLEIERVPTTGKPKPQGLAALGPIALAADHTDAVELRTTIERFATAAFRDVRPEPGYVQRLAAIYDVAPSRRRQTRRCTEGNVGDRLGVAGVSLFGRTSRRYGLRDARRSRTRLPALVLSLERSA